VKVVPRLCRCAVVWFCGFGREEGSGLPSPAVGFVASQHPANVRSGHSSRTNVTFARNRGGCFRLIPPGGSIGQEVKCRETPMCGGLAESYRRAGIDGPTWVGTGDLSGVLMGEH